MNVATSRATPFRQSTTVPNTSNRAARTLSPPPISQVTSPSTDQTFLVNSNDMSQRRGSAQQKHQQKRGRRRNRAHQKELRYGAEGRRAKSVLQQHDDGQVDHVDAIARRRQTIEERTAAVEAFAKQDRQAEAESEAGHCLPDRIDDRLRTPAAGTEKRMAA